MRQRITARPTADHGLGVGGGPRTKTQHVYIYADVVDGPANTIGRQMVLELTRENTEWLIRSLSERLESGVAS